MLVFFIQVTTECSVLVSFVVTVRQLMLLLVTIYISYINKNSSYNKIVNLINISMKLTNHELITVLSKIKWLIQSYILLFSSWGVQGFSNSFFWLFMAAKIKLLTHFIHSGSSWLIKTENFVLSSKIDISGNFLLSFANKLLLCTL